jgi:hypothetical protein
MRMMPRSVVTSGTPSPLDDSPVRSFAGHPLAARDQSRNTSDVPLSIT